MIRQYLHPEYYNMPESLMVDKAEHVGKVIINTEKNTLTWTQRSLSWCLASGAHVSGRSHFHNLWVVAGSAYPMGTAVLRSRMCQFWCKTTSLPHKFRYILSIPQAIHAWAATRAIDIFDPKYLSHPTKGMYGEVPGRIFSWQSRVGFPFKHDSSKPDHEGTVYSHDWDFARVSATGLPFGPSAYLRRYPFIVQKTQFHRLKAVC